MSNRKWTTEEITLAFDIYCRIPYSKIEVTRPEIKELADLLGRTCGAVKFKMFNLASCDPYILNSNRTGLKNGSQLDKAVFAKYAKNAELLAQDVESIKNNILLQQQCHINETIIPFGGESLVETRQRIGQTFFRDYVLAAYNNKCCITGITLPDLLIASHIKPWKDSDPSTERTDPCNGVLLNALHDKAFDKGWMTITEDYRIKYSPLLKEIVADKKTTDWLLHYENMCITMPDRFIPNKEYLKYHYENIFIK